jgi:hypothetical protein
VSVAFVSAETTQRISLLTQRHQYTKKHKASEDNRHLKKSSVNLSVLLCVDLTMMKQS